ncbi:peptidase [Jannaschia ovalis]|uniref:Peptidase n=1 Tax=Jannaschia ovalis TaxID=3038773 RepID=A0ABY8LF07_9RHOB|nr:peptidase [Jannaschia sp. GRR-S6-38]WGH79885.1 peptidase [Jannaschia sp. GRR-S6-38]
MLPLADRLAAREQQLKWLALGLGLASTIAIVQNWHPWPMVLGLPFCVIWIYCAWLHGERQLKWLNILFSALYLYGIVRWMLPGG